MMTQNWQFFTLLLTLIGSWLSIILYLTSRIDRVEDRLTIEIHNIRDMLTGKA